MPAPTIDPRTVHEARSAGKPCLCLDVRTPIEHRSVHADGVHLMPLDQLDPAEVTRLREGDRPVYVFCRSGGRASQAVERLTSAGITGCFVVEGGTDGWASAGLPVVRGTKSMSLERQVRIAAGSLILIGVVLGTWVHAGCYGLSAFVGAGLVFAGLTDWCGMGLLLARMPWNRIAGPAKSAGDGCCGR